MFVYVLHLKFFWNIYIFWVLGGGGAGGVGVCGGVWGVGVVVSLHGSLIRSSNSLVLIGAYYAWEVENR